MKCQNCGADLPDDSQFCNKCGTEVIFEENHTEQQHIMNQVFVDNENVINESIPSKKNDTLRTILIIGIICLLVVGLYFLYPIFQYNHAQNLLSTHQYDQAIKNFTELKDYKDSPNQINNCKYQQAKDLLKSGKYDEAMSEFIKLNKYSDSVSMISECEYQSAKHSISIRDYESADKLFSALGKYKDSSTLAQETEYCLAIKYYDEKQYSESAQLFEKLVNYKDVKSKLNDIIYLDAKSKYTEGDFSGSQTQFQKIQEYKDSKTYLGNISRLIKLQGTWQIKDQDYWQIIFSGWKLSDVFYKSSGATQVNNFDYKFDKNQLTDGFAIYTINGNNLVVKNDQGNTIFTKYSDSSTAPSSSPDPQIGMTAEEVRQSSWGSPEDINKTTTASTVHEQWVYSNNQYIYLDDGVVTAIQD